MKIYIIGDSISIHYGPYLERLLRGTIEYSRKEGEEEALLDLDHPQGANGGDSSMVLSFLRARMPDGRIGTDLMLINCGLHDIKTDPVSGTTQVPLQQYEKNLREIVKVVTNTGIPMVWIRTTPCDEAVHNPPGGSGVLRFKADCAAYNAAADGIMKNAGVPCIDLHGFTANLGPELYCDHVHFVEPVREKQAAFIAGWLDAWMQHAM